MFNAACLYHFRWRKKKNSKHFIIPASYFKKLGIKPIPVSKPKTPENPSINSPTAIANTVTTNNTAVKTPVQTDNNTPQKIVLKGSTRVRSGLSLRSIRAKKEHILKKIDVVVDEENLPTDPFTEEQLLPLWDSFIKTLLEEGQMNLASILGIDTPKLKGTTIHLEFPNSTNKVEVERQQFELLQFLRKSLNNFDISLNIIVNEEVQKKFAYTPEDKYEKLKEINPNIELLRSLFDLGI